MYCANCGAWNQEESVFCANCGRPLAEKQTQRKARIGLCLLLVLGLVAVVLIVVVVGALLLRERLSAAWQGFVSQPTPTLMVAATPPTQTAILVTPTLPPSPTPTLYVPPTTTPMPTVTPKPTAAQRTFKLVYKQCVPHGSSLGSVKGQVFDKSGRVIPGAKVRIRINDFDWKSDANPATTNAEGWYEWTLEVEQKVKFMELTVAGRTVPFSPEGFEVKSQGGCFQRVDFVEQ
jgi:predicted nucleic acid-binding Zn ribbon protein